MSTFGVDEYGLIITKVASEKIDAKFQPIVKNVLESAIQEFGSQLESFYLYGSIATGEAVEGKSDLDAILVFKSPPTERILSQVASLRHQLTNRYENCLREVGLETTYLEEALNPKETYGLLCFLKHLCICLFGNDITSKLGGYKPSEKVARGFNGDFVTRLHAIKSNVEGATTESDLKKISQSLAKRLLRTGFSLVMPRCRSWTTDLEVSRDTFIKYYPEKANEMNQALEWSKSGVSDRNTIKEFCDSFGDWLGEEFERVIPVE